MTPDELPADMDGVVSEWLGMADEAEAFRSGLKSVVICQTEIDYLRDLLKAYQEQRRALEDLLALPVAAQAFVYLDKGIGTKTQSAAWLRARAALNQKGDER